MTTCKNCGRSIHLTINGDKPEWLHDASQFPGDRWCPPRTAAEPPDDYEPDDWERSVFERVGEATS